MKTTETGRANLKRLIQRGGYVESFAHLPAGVQECFISPSGARRYAMFVSLKDGEILASCRVNLIRSSLASDSERRAWCRLAGVSMTDLRRVIRATREEEKAAEEARALVQLRSAAKRKGYKLVPA